MEKIGGRASVFVCTNYACQLPVFEPEELAGLIQ
jgi:uncharacterized protein YyaL (SSP411 family)